MEMPNSGSLNTGYSEVSKGLPSIARGAGYKNVTDSKTKDYLLDRMDRHDRGRRNAEDISEMRHGIKMGRSTQRLSGGTKRKMRIAPVTAVPDSLRKIAANVRAQTKQPSPFDGVKGARAAGGDGATGDPVPPMRKTVVSRNGYQNGSYEMTNRSEGKPTLTWATKIPMFPKSGPRAQIIQKADQMVDLPIPDWAKQNFSMRPNALLNPLNIHASSGQMAEGYRKVAGKRIWPWQRKRVLEGANQMALGRTTLYQPLGTGRNYS